MGISDDIRPKRSYHSKEKAIDVPIEDDDSEEENDIDIKNDEPEDEPKELDHKELEELENDFFDNKHTKKKKKERETEKKPSPDKSQPKRSIAKPTVWIMVILLLGLLVWQNYSEIVSAVKKVLFKGSTTTSTTSNKTDEYYTGESTSSAATTTTPAATEPAKSTATTTTPEIDKATIAIEILNGNGIKNSASKVKAELETAGFKISRVTNAKNFNYKTTLIYFKTGKDKEADSVKTALPDRQTSTENNDSLVGDYDVIIIIGAK